MQGCRRSKLLLAAMLAMLTYGCQSSGRQQSTRSGGPSPSFGLNYVPRQSEPPVESVAKGGNSTSRTVESRTPATADLDDPAGGPGDKNGIKLVSWMSGREKAPAEPQAAPHFVAF